MVKGEFVIGVLGGMGTYATINLFKQYAMVFQAEKEWDRPRIIIDNRCTMPSRVRAFLYNENVDELIDEMSDSMQNLVNGGCSKIILACNTSHLFLPSIYEKVPFLEDKVVDIIKNCVHIIKQNNIETIHLLGSEGTIESKVYQSLLNENGIKCTVPMNEEYGVLRECIEAVKQNKYTEDIGRKFCNLVNGHESVILGCTELPILYDKYNENINCENIYDPLFLALQQLKKEFDDE